MRQGEIIVGTGVLAGVLLSVYVKPGFVWVSGFFGAGLLFAGISNTCLLARLLRILPWNK